jgi:hypothetical protein
LTTYFKAILSIHSSPRPTRSEISNSLSPVPNLKKNSKLGLVARNDLEPLHVSLVDPFLKDVAVDDRAGAVGGVLLREAADFALEVVVCKRRDEKSENSQTQRAQ